MSYAFPGRPCPRRLIVGRLRALQENCAVHRFLHRRLSPLPYAVAFHFGGVKKEAAAGLIERGSRFTGPPHGAVTPPQH